MIIETNLRVCYQEKNYEVFVKMIRLGEVCYFYIRNKDPQFPLISDDQLQLSYKNANLQASASDQPVFATPQTVISAIQDEIVANRKIWFWE